MNGNLVVLLYKLLILPSVLNYHRKMHFFDGVFFLILRRHFTEFVKNGKKMVKTHEKKTFVYQKE